MTPAEFQARVRELDARLEDVARRLSRPELGLSDALEVMRANIVEAFGAGYAAVRDPDAGVGIAYESCDLKLVVFDDLEDVVRVRYGKGTYKTAPPYVVVAGLRLMPELMLRLVQRGERAAQFIAGIERLPEMSDARPASEPVCG